MAIKEQKRDTLELVDILQELKKHWILFLLLILFCGALGFAVSEYAIVPQYESAVMMIVNTRQDQTGNVTNDNIQSAQNLVSTYSIIIKSNTVLNRVIARLGLDMDYNDLRDSVFVNAVDDTQVMRIVVRNKDPELAATIVEGIAGIAPSVIVSAVEAGSCKVISQVSISEGPVTPNVMKNTLLAISVGILVAIVITTLHCMFRVKKIIDDEDVIKYLDLPVLGVIPEIERDKRSEK